MYTIIVTDDCRYKILSIDNVVETDKATGFLTVGNIVKEYLDRAMTENVKIEIDVFEWQDGQKDRLMITLKGGPK